MNSFFAEFISGQLNPPWTHGILLGGAIIAEALVAAGILLESPKDKGFREWLGLGLVFGGVVISAIFTIALFVFDEGISGTQSTELKSAEAKLGDAIKTAATANERAANLEKEAAAANVRAAEMMRITAWRTFKEEQIISLTHSFEKSTGKLAIAWSPNDSEALALAIQFSNIFTRDDLKSKWVLSGEGQPAVATSIVWGIDIPDVPDATETVKAVRQAFSDAGVPFETAALPRQQSGIFFGGPPRGEAGVGRAIIFFGSRRPTLGQSPF